MSEVVVFPFLAQNDRHDLNFHLSHTSFVFAFFFAGEVGAAKHLFAIGVGAAKLLVVELINS